MTIRPILISTAKWMSCMPVVHACVCVCVVCVCVCVCVACVACMSADAPVCVQVIRVQDLAGENKSNYRSNMPPLACILMAL